MPAKRIFRAPRLLFFPKSLSGRFPWPERLFVFSSPAVSGPPMAPKDRLRPQVL